MDQRATDTATYIATDYELQRDADRLATTASLYGFVSGASYCVVCLRRFVPRSHSGGQPQIYCSSACRSRAGDTRRRELTREWRTCAACGGPFVALAEDQVVCPPPWPASPHDRNADCAAQRRRDLNREVQRRARERAALRAAEHRE